VVWERFGLVLRSNCGDFEIALGSFREWLNFGSGLDWFCGLLVAILLLAGRTPNVRLGAKAQEDQPGLIDDARWFSSRLPGTTLGL